MSQHATHIRKKTGEKVVVTREYNVVVVKSTQGRFIGSYEQGDMAKFQRRYEPLKRKEPR